MSITDAMMRRVAPILTSFDIDATEAFYTGKLGFRTVSKYVDFGYLIMARDQITLHFTRAASGSPATTESACYLYVDGIDALYAQAVDAAAVHPNGALGARPWGMREFALLDNDGNLLRIGEEVVGK